MVALLVAVVIADRTWDLAAFLDPDNVGEFLTRAGRLTNSRITTCA